jgi:RNA polymerase sigma-70 factor (ECF subfamily)
MIRLLQSKNCEKKLLCGIRDNDLTSFELLYNRYKRNIYSFALRYLKNPYEAEDVVQIAFINLWEHRSSLDEAQSVKSYLYRSVVNLIYNTYKKRAIRSRYVEYELNRLDHSSNPTYDLVLQHDLEKNINDVVSTLPPQQQKIFRLSRNSNFSHEEIAGKLDLSVRTVENQIYRTLKVIRKHLDIKT